MSDHDLVPRPKTQLLGLDQHVAGALCYVPVMMLNYLLPVVFLATEPREHHLIRFHAAQGLLYSLAFLAVTVGGAFVSGLAPVLALLLGQALDLEGPLTLAGVAIQLVATLVLLVAVLGGMVGFLALAVLTGSDRNPRVPGLAAIADRLVGPPPLP